MNGAGAISDRAGGAPDGPQAAYHVDLRQFPHNACRFNLTRQELWSAIVEPWAREQWIEMGERKWNPHQAKLTILEGPRIPVEQLSLGRGWRVAQRQARDVTQQLLAAARDVGTLQSGAATMQGRQIGAQRDVQIGAPQSGQPGPTREDRSQEDRSGASGDDRLLADSLGLEFLEEIGAGEAPLRRVWELACVRHPERSAGLCLMLAERAVGSLVEAGLVALIRADRAGHSQGEVPAAELQSVLRAVDSWTGDGVALTRR